jgi:hypothetical protein
MITSPPLWRAFAEWMFRRSVFQTVERRHLEFEYHVMKGDRIPYPSAIFDMALNVLYHIDLEAWQSVMLELKAPSPPRRSCLHHGAHSPRSVDSSASASLPIRQTRAPSQGSAGVFSVSHVLLGPFSSEHACSVEQRLNPLPVGARTPQGANVKPPIGWSTLISR